MILVIVTAKAVTSKKTAVELAVHNRNGLLLYNERSCRPPLEFEDSATKAKQDSHAPNKLVSNGRLSLLHLIMSLSSWIFWILFVCSPT